MKTIDNLLFELRSSNVSLWVEGDRLRYRAAKDVLTPAHLAQLKEHKVEILAFLRDATAITKSQLPSLEPIERNGNLPLSFAQQRLWFLHQFEPDSSSNNMPVVVRFTGSLNVAALEQSIQEVVRRHEILRTTFPAVDGQPTLVIKPDVSLSLPVIDLREMQQDEREAEAYRLATQEARLSFDLAKGPILRVLLLCLSDNEHLLIWNMHCMVCDGASSDVFYQDLTALYAAFSAGTPSPLSNLPIQYADFAHWQRQWLQGEVLESQLNYWKQKLEGDLPLIQLPYDRPRPLGVQTYRGDRGARMLPQSLNYALTSLSQQLGATLFMTLLAAFEVLLYRYSEQEDMLISFASAGRGMVETEGLIGFFSNTLILRTKIEGNPSFRELLDRVRKESLKAYAHQDLPFEKLIEELRPEQSQNRSPLFQVKFALNPPWSNGRGMASVQLPELTITSLFGYIYHGKTKYDLTLVMREQDEGLGMVFDYNAEMFDATTIERMIGHFHTLLEGIVANPDQRISDLPLLTPQEHQLLETWHGTGTPDIQAECIHQIFADRVKQTPDAIAIVFQDKQLTYRELNCRANQLAHYLKVMGVAPEVPVGLCLEQSPEAIVGLLGVFKAGGTCIPINPNDSPERLAFILEDAQVSILLTESAIAQKINAYPAKVINLDTDWGTIQQQSQDSLTSEATADIAYVIYPSTSFGKPNGISITHRSVVRLVQQLDDVGLQETEAFLQFHPLCSNTATFEIWGCLLNGAKLAIFPGYAGSSGLGQVIQQHQITTLWLPTRLLHRMVNEQLTALKSVRQLFTGGDILSVAAVQKLLQALPDCRLMNVYSLLENAGITCCYAIAEPIPTNTAIPIGRPIADTQVYILDSHLQPVPVGVVGELYIGGLGLARGESDEPKSRLYKTGDLARYLSDGNIEFVGNIKNLVKIQGLRIEVGRIETALSQHPAVWESVVLAQQNSPKGECLVAYVLLNPNQTTTTSELRNFLKEKLHAYMVPSVFVFLDTLPLTPDGKIDYRQLPDPDRFSQELEENFVASRDELELKLTKIWEQVLGIQPIGVKDNFFELGGHSLLAVRLFAQIEETFDKNLPLATLLQAPTIELLADTLRTGELSESWSPLVKIQAGGSKPPLFCIHGGGFNVLVYRDLAVNLDSDQPVYGLQARGLDGNNQPIRNRIEAIATDYVKEIQTIQPEGPYFLAGLSNGGHIALEMAQQLHGQGQKVALLAMFDSYGPGGIELLPPLPRLLSSLLYVLWYGIPSFVTKLTRLEPSSALSTVLDRLSAFKRIFNLHQATVKQLQDERIRDLDTQHLTTNTSKVERWMNNVSQFILEHSPWAFFSPTAQLKGMEGALPDTLKKLEEVYTQAYKAYEPKAYPGSITLFQASDLPPGFEIDPQLGWGKIATGGVEIYKVPGHHTSIMQSPYLAEKMNACLNKTLNKFHVQKPEVYAMELVTNPSGTY